MGILDIILLIVSVSVLIFAYVSIRKEFNGNKKLTIEERITKLEAVARTQEILLTNYYLGNIIMRRDLITCESCGCVVLRGNAMKGKSEIKTEDASPLLSCHEEEYIYTPYYCKECYQDYLKTKKEKK